MQRREFIQLSSALTGIGLLSKACTVKRPVPGEIAGASASVGHLLRDGHFGEPVSGFACEVAIIGGGVSGLSAARWLKKNGIGDLCILDLEKQMGGNAACGQNAVSAYPWGAHYVPIPNNNLTEYGEFLEESGVITGRDEKGLPEYNEYFLCFDPQERLYINGRWQDGLIPRGGLPVEDQAEINRFLQQMDQFRQANGSDGLPAFSIPVDRSSKDTLYTALDKLTMKEWLQQNNYHSSYLQWYVNYCTRDDFGTRYEAISAWTGIHYFACRKGTGSNAKHYDVLTWPQGNGWLVEQLSKPIRHCLKPNALVVKLNPSPEKLEVRYYDTLTKEVKAIWPQHIIVAVPQFVANRLLPVSPERDRIVKEEMHYTPWMVANMTVGELEERSGAPLSWDNVVFDSESLGYVEATHQQVQQLKEKRVLTYYLPLTNEDPVAARKNALQRSHAEWVRLIFDDLRKVHPDIEERTERIDLMIWGHAMAQPRPGWIHGGDRQVLQQSYNERIHFAHTDVAGISIFEEAFYQGIGAANKILGKI
ncbi:MAG TPA: NAD(P)-binding protein [Puia sp.]|nr:NAD(P)-binding protein [Puia sp.]